MNCYEADMIRKQQLIKELEENPGRRLESYKILLENKIKFRKEQIEAWRQGRPFIDDDTLAPRLFRAMGFVPIERGVATMPKDGTLPGARSFSELKERSRAMGLPVDTACEQTINWPAVIATGDMPDESIVYCSQRGCPLKVFQKLVIVYQLGKWQKSDIFGFDRPFEENEVSLEYIVEQLREFIEFSEKKFPGVIKYDEGKLIEYQNITEAMKVYFVEIYEMLKHVPSPIAGQDIIDIPPSKIPQWDPANIEYARAKRDEVAERLAKGIYRVPGEKLRMLWNPDMIFFFDPFEVLEKRGVSVLFWLQPESEDYTSPWPTPAYYGGRKLTPLEEEARWLLSQLRGGTGAHWMDHMIRVCRDLKIDAVINLHQPGATCCNGLNQIMAHRTEKELGIPTLQLEGRRQDSSYIDEATIKAKLDEFALMCLSQRGLA